MSGKDRLLVVLSVCLAIAQSIISNVMSNNTIKREITKALEGKREKNN